ncbi:MAG: serine hydrolase [Deltaproteobacteria bacterium]|nr:serine hydrolase [Deltaproteobacteria bacterium]
MGHLGFAGTSVWMDLEKDVIVILLTNRVHPTRNNRKIKVFRPMLHDLIMEELGED